jgi:hypothetical protein
MATKKQLSANRRNAEHSTGPKTADGKQIASMNSLKHGLLARSPLLPTEDAAEFNNLLEDLRQDLKPEGVLQSFCVERLAYLIQKSQRANNFEVGILAGQYHKILAERAGKQAARNSRPETGSLVALEPIGSLASNPQILDADKYEQAITERELQQSAQETETATLGEAFVRANDESAFANLLRYSKPIDRAIGKTLELLLFLQAQRRARSRPSAKSGSGQL